MTENSFYDAIKHLIMKKANEEMGNYDAVNIYEAIKELEDLQNRSCDNCKYRKLNVIDGIYCDMFQCYQQKALKYCGNWELKC